MNLGDLMDVLPDVSTAPEGKVLGTTSYGVWGPVDPQLSTEETPSAVLGGELSSGSATTQVVACTPGAYYQVGGAGVTAVTLDGAELPMPGGASAGQTSFRATASTHTLVRTGGTSLSVREITLASAPSAVAPGGLEIRRRATNTAIGIGVQDSVTTSTGCTAVGNMAQSSVTTGSSNTALGEYAQMQLFSGVSNTGVGRMSQYSLTSGSYNTSLGYYSQFALTTGQWNTAVGYWSQAAVTVGEGLTAVGHYAQAAITTGAQNTAIGLFAQSKATTGGYNTAAGAYAQRNLVSAGMCTAVGYYAQYSVTSGYYNTAVGYYAQHGTTTGAYNTALGYNAQRTNITGRYNLALGAAAGYHASQGTALDGTVAIGTDSSGAGAYTTASNQIVLGTSMHTTNIPGALVLTGTDAKKWRLSIDPSGVLTTVAA
jgi:hypothetical protein